MVSEAIAAEQPVLQHPERITNSGILLIGNNNGII
jgi:hypothetical protein